MTFGQHRWDDIDSAQAWRTSKGTPFAGSSLDDTRLVCGMYHHRGSTRTVVNVLHDESRNVPIKREAGLTMAWLPSLVIAQSILLCFCVSCSVPAGETHRIHISKQTPGEVEFHVAEPVMVEAGVTGLVGSDIETMGVRIGCDIVPVSSDSLSGGGTESEVRTGDDLSVRFFVSDTTTGAPISGARPGAWIHPHHDNGGETCREKIQSWVAGSLIARAEYDLNEFYVLVLNDEPSISVIDPLFGYGGSKLLSLIGLPAVGEDWVLSKDRSLLYVSTPRVNQIVVINTSNWKVVEHIDVGIQPTRIRLQPDGKYLWVSCTWVDQAANTIYVIDTDTLKVSASFGGGNDHHDFAFSTDSLVAYVADAGLARVSVIDTQKLEVLSLVDVGQSAGGVVYSPISHCAYIVDTLSGTITVVDGATHQRIRRVSAQPGLGTIRVVPGGRYLLVANEKLATVDVIDVASDTVIQTADVGPEPDQIIFTLSLAYVRSRGSELILMIPLEQIGTGERLSVADFTGGHAPFGLAATTSVADGMAPAPGGLAAIVANPADRSVYYYREGMAAPMGSFQSYGREPRAVLVVDRSLRETPPGVYGTSLKIDRPGVYDVAFFLDVPRILHCFELVVGDSPASLAVAPALAVQIQPLDVVGETVHDEPVRVRYSVHDAATGEPIESLDDFGVLAFSSGNWQQRRRAQSLGQGIYEATFVIPASGVYHVYCQVPSLDLMYRDLPSRVLHVQ